MYNSDQLENFILPQGNVLIPFQGEPHVAVLIFLIIQANNGLPERAKVIFANTGLEHKETIGFVLSLASEWGFSLEIVETHYPTSPKHPKSVACVDRYSLSDAGEPFQRLIERRKSLPNLQDLFCSYELKTWPLEQHLANCDWLTWHTAYPDYDAEHPNTRFPQTLDQHIPWTPLIKAEFTEDCFEAFWNQKQGVGPPASRPPFGCNGCFLRSDRQIFDFITQYPKLNKWWILAETKIRAMNTNPDKTFFRRDISRERLSATYKKHHQFFGRSPSISSEKQKGTCRGI